MRILYHGDSPNIATGYGTVSRLLIKNLLAIDKDIRIEMISKNEPYRKIMEFERVRIHPVGYDKVEKLLGFQKLADVVKGVDKDIKDEFDVYIYNGDFVHFDYVNINNIPAVKFFRENFSFFKKKIMYTAIDSDVIYPEWLKIFDLFDTIIVPSNFARNALIKADPKIDEKIKVIPYGLEVEKFNINEKKNDRPSFLKNKFVIGYVGKNQWRKDLGLMLETFRIFKSTVPEAFLYLHTAENDENNYFGNLKTVLDRMGLKRNLDYYISFKSEYLNGHSRKSMPDVYGYFDVYLSTSVGEGYGLPIAEAMLSGVPVVAMNNSAVSELLDDHRGFAYDPDSIRIFGWYDFMREREVGRIRDVLYQLNFVYVDKKRHGQYIKDYTKRARQFIEKRTDKKMGEDFYKLLPTESEIKAIAVKKRPVEFQFPTTLNYYFDGYARLVRYINQHLNSSRDPKYRLHFGMPRPVDKKDGVKDILFTMFEADRIPDKWVEDINKYYDGLILPSEFTISVFKKCGVKVEIKKVPLFASDFRIFNPRSEPFVFGHQNSLVEGGQKGWDLVIRAFLKLFYGRTDVKLLLKAREHHWANSKWYFDQLKKQDNIEVIIEDFTDQEMNDKFYSRLNCFVYPSRGEGWGLPPTESIAHGIPTILTKAHSHTEFSKFGIEIGTVGTAFPFYHRRTHDMGIGLWVEPSIVELESAMMDVFKMYSAYKSEAIEKQNKFKNLYNGENFINNLITAVYSF